MKKEYETPIALCQWLAVEDIVRTSGGLDITEDTDSGYGPLIPLS